MIITHRYRESPVFNFFVGVVLRDLVFTFGPQSDIRQRLIRGPRSRIGWFVSTASASSPAIIFPPPQLLRHLRG